MIQLLLATAELSLHMGDYSAAINDLSQARALARQGDTQRCKAIAVHCTAAMQAILPLAVEARYDA